MSDNWEDDLETAGPGFATEFGEGTELPAGTLREGYLTRYIARKFGQKLIITEEALEDTKYERVLDAARRLKRAMWKTADMDATLMLVRATNTSYVGGDGLPLASASHTLANGGTFSNTMSTPMSPSVPAITVARSAVMKYPGHDGITEGYDFEKVVCPVEQWAVWEGLTKSSMAPEPGNFAEINVVKPLDLKVVPLRFWTNTSTNYCYITDCDNGVNFRWRRRPRSRTWVDNDNEVMKYGISARWARGWTDPRCVHFVNA